MNLLRNLLLVFTTFSGFSAWGMEPVNDVDPWESMNRRIFAFNETLDNYALLPIARGYKFVMPDSAERGVGNFILNIYEVNSVFNSLMQGRPTNALQTGGRFLVNTALGFGGLFDVATLMGIEPSPADFGQTLYTWGFEEGPFVMLPLIGPKTIRSGTGFFFDTYTSIPAFLDWKTAYLFWTLEVVDIRANLIKADDLITGDRYIFIRNAYMQRREYFVTGGKVTDTFSEFEEGDEYEDF